MNKYDYLVIGCGLFGTVFARRAVEKGKRVLVIEKRDHVGGNCYTESVENINVHKYGPHIFHTNYRDVWRYVKRFADFNNFINRPKVFYKGRIYSFPINLMTLHQLWGITTPQEAEKRLTQAAVSSDNPQNLEDWILSKVGPEIYEVFIKGYTAKQWGKAPSLLPTSIIKRVPIRLDFNDNYYNDLYQGVPVGGYSNMFKKMLEGIDVKLNTNYFQDRDYWNGLSDYIVFTGKTDEFFDYKFGRLEYRSLKFKTRILDGDFQGNAVINHTDPDVPYTRTIEHKHFEFTSSDKTVVTWEYPDDYTEGKIPYYPTNDEHNNRIYSLYKTEAERHKNVIFGGRLATYSYLDMDQTILQALQVTERL